MTAADSTRARLPATLRSAGDARRLVRGFLEDRRCHALVDDAELLVTELVTNAVLHAHSEVGLRVLHRPGALRVEVTDASPAPPAPRRPAVDAVTGRGLLLVATLSESWGTDAHPAGKTVWFELSDGACADRLHPAGEP